MTGHRTCSDNYIRERKSQGNQILLQLRQSLKLMYTWKRKVKRATGEPKNDKHSPCHFEWHNTKSKVVHACWHKNWPSKKRHNLTECNRLRLQQGMSQLPYCKRVHQMVEMQTHQLHPKTVME